MSSNRDILRKALEHRAGCVPVERFEALGPADAEHIASCPRCRTELALYREFNESVPSETEGAAVEWIRAETARRWQPAPKSFRKSWSLLWTFAPIASLAAALVLLVVVNHGPSVRELPTAPGAPVYRSAAIEMIAPVGELQSAPVELRWRAVAAATRYTVRVTEVDDAILWQAIATEPRIPVPPAVRVRMLPAKALLWSVTAEDARGNAVASSALEKFWVRSKPIPTGE